MDILENIEKEQLIKEAVYSGNIGFEEMVRFYQKASPKEIKMMEKLLKNENWKRFKELIKKVLGIELK